MHQSNINIRNQILSKELDRAFDIGPKELDPNFSTSGPFQKAGSAETLESVEPELRETEFSVFESEVT